MTITFMGAVATYLELGNDAVTQNLFVLSNGIASRVDVYIRRLAIQADQIAANAVVMPIVKTSRCTAVSGGSTLAKAGFDTAQTSDPNVVALAPVELTNKVYATPDSVAWGHYIQRLGSTAEQQVGDDNNLLPWLVDTRNFVLRPGESLLCQLTTTVGTNNAMQNRYGFLTCAWEEDSITTFAISGTVTLSSAPLDGARVTVIEADDINLTNAFLRGVYVTAGGGLWASDIRTGKIGAAFVQYTTGGTYYTAPGSPYLGT